MQRTSPATDAWLRAVRSDPESTLVAFDFDGTLAPIVDDPDQAVAHPDAPRLLEELAAVVGHVAVITGRPAGVATERLELATGRRKDVVVLGHYGLERWDSATGEVQEPPTQLGLARVRRELPDLLASVDAGDAYIEDKTVAVAVHTRRSSDPTGSFERLREPLAELAESAGLALEPGRLVLELRPPGVDKGGALRGLVDESSARAVAFVGDDLGDMPAFDTLDALRAEGLSGLLVCSGSAEVPALAVRADVVVDGPAGVMEWLRALLADLTAQG